VAKATVDLIASPSSHLFRFAERFIVARIWAVPGSAFLKWAASAFAGAAFATVDTNPLVEPVVKNPEIRHGPVPSHFR
jgi:hypothetical protein